MMIDDSAVQSQKAKSPTDTTEFGMMIDDNLKQFLKALEFICVNPSVKRISVTSDRRP